MFDSDFSFHVCKMIASYARISSNDVGFINVETESQRNHRLVICSKLGLDCVF